MSPKNEYSYSEIKDMQQDAVNRVHKMWEQSQQHIKNTQAAINSNNLNNKSNNSNNDSCNNNKSNFTENKISSNPNQTDNSPPFKDFISKLGLDSETVILLLLLLLFVNEGVDTELILALVYILI